MPRKDKETLRKIHEAAEKEFLEKGFKNASLRNIVKTVGVTTGAFYGYYKSKEELFEALVDSVWEYFFRCHDDVQQRFDSLSMEEQKKSMGNYSLDYTMEGLKYAYSNLNRMKLLLTAADGTKYENFLHDLVEKEIESTHSFIGKMQESGMSANHFTPYFEHTIISGMYKSMFELIIHDVPFEEAMECAKEICRFYRAGWMTCMGLQ